MTWAEIKEALSLAGWAVLIIAVASFVIIMAKSFT